MFLLLLQKDVILYFFLFPAIEGGKGGGLSFKGKGIQVSMRANSKGGGDGWGVYLRAASDDSWLGMFLTPLIVNISREVVYRLKLVTWRRSQGQANDRTGELGYEVRMIYRNSVSDPSCESDDYIS